MTRVSVVPLIAKSSILIAAAVGVTTADFGSAKWATLQIVLFASPLVALIYPSEHRLIWAFWGSQFLVLQGLVSPFFIDRDFMTLAPNVREVVNVKDGIPGIHGPQVITTDWKGFRTTRAVDYASRNKGGVRIYAIGGSTTEQIYIDDNHTWTNILQESLEKLYGKNVEVINTGVSGTRAIHHLATLRNIASLHPDIALFLVGINDWNAHILRHFTPHPQDRGGVPKAIAQFRDSFSLKNTILGNAVNQLFNLLIASSGNKRQSVRDDFGEYYTPQRQSLDRKIVYHFKPQAVMEEYASKLDEISAACKRYGIRCVFVSQPTGYQASASESFKKGFWMTPPNQDYTIDFESLIHIASIYNEYLKAFSKRRNHYLCDAAAELTAAYANFYDDCHLNIAGAQRMGQIVSQCVQNIDFKPVD